MVDYTSIEPPFWQLPPHPPVKGGGAVTQRAQYLAPILAGGALLGLVYIYFNQDDTMIEYWRQVEQGNVPLEGDDEFDDSDDNDEWDEDEAK